MAIVEFIRAEAARLRAVANDYAAEHHDRESARRALRDAEALGKLANQIERGEHRP